jgi:hypothetical protein
MNGTGLRPELAGRIRDDRVLAAFLSPFRSLAQPGDADLGRSFERFAETVSGSEIQARVLFRVLASDGRTARPWSLELRPGGYEVSTEPAHRPDLEVLVGEGTWRQLAEGAVSPLEAFALGDLRVRGDIRLAGQLAGMLQRV